MQYSSIYAKLSQANQNFSLNPHQLQGASAYSTQVANSPGGGPIKPSQSSLNFMLNQ